MATAPLCTIADVTNLSGETYVEPEATQVETLIRRASALIRQNTRDLNARLDGGRLDAEIVTGVAVDVASRALDVLRTGRRVTTAQYPEITQVLRATGDDLVYLTPAELAQLNTDVGQVARRTQVHSVRLLSS